MKRTRIKLCGMKDPSQVSSAVTLGVDAIGIIFYEKSPRYLSVEKAKLIRKVVPAFVNLVGVFVNESIDKINTIANDVGLDIIQLHGDETVAEAEKLTRPYLRAIQVKSVEHIQSQIELHKNARGYLLDSFSEKKYGGTGTVFEKKFLPKEMPDHVIFAGGISALTIDDVLALKPYAIDINSGVETSPGDKDLKKLSHLISLVRKHDTIEA